MKKMMVLLVLGLLIAGGIVVVVLTQTNSISLEEAKEIALQEIDGEIVSYEADGNEYQFDILLDDILYDVEVSAATGKITDIGVEAKNNASTIATITIEQAKEIALGEVSGTIEDIDLENGVYKVEVKASLFEEWNITIDATTGEILLSIKD